MSCANATSPFAVDTDFPCPYPWRPLPDGNASACEATFAGAFQVEWTAFQVAGCAFTLAFLCIFLLEVLGTVRYNVAYARRRGARTTWVLEWWRQRAFKDRAVHAMIVLLACNAVRGGDLLGSAGFVPFVATFAFGTVSNVAAFVACVLYAISVTGALTRVSHPRVRLRRGTAIYAGIVVLAAVYALSSFGDAAPCVGVTFFVWRTTALGLLLLVLGVTLTAFMLPAWPALMQQRSRARVTPLPPAPAGLERKRLPLSVEGLARGPDRLVASCEASPRGASSSGAPAIGEPSIVKAGWTEAAAGATTPSAWRDLALPTAAPPHPPLLPGSDPADPFSGTLLPTRGSSDPLASGDVTPVSDAPPDLRAPSGELPARARLAQLDLRIPRGSVSTRSAAQLSWAGLRGSTVSDASAGQSLLKVAEAAAAVPPVVSPDATAVLVVPAGNLPQLARSFMLRILIVWSIANACLVAIGVALVVVGISALGEAVPPSLSVKGLERPFAMWTTPSMLITFWGAPPLGFLALNEKRALREARALWGLLAAFLYVRKGKAGADATASARHHERRARTLQAQFGMPSPATHSNSSSGPPGLGLSNGRPASIRSLSNGSGHGSGAGILPPPTPTPTSARGSVQFFPSSARGGGGGGGLVGAGSSVFFPSSARGSSGIGGAASSQSMLSSARGSFISGGAGSVVLFPPSARGSVSSWGGGGATDAPAPQPPDLALLGSDTTPVRMPSAGAAGSTLDGNAAFRSTPLEAVAEESDEAAAAAADAPGPPLPLLGSTAELRE